MTTTVTKPSASPGPTAADKASLYLTQLSASYTAELVSKMERLDAIIGDAHWPSVGSFKESILRRHLSDKVPRTFEVGTGFVLAVEQSSLLRSLQLDIIVWDSAHHAPIFRDGDFVIVPPEAVAAAFSVKKKLTAATLRDSLTNLDSLSRLLHLRARTKPVYTGVFAFERHARLTFPGSVLDELYHYYANCPSPTIHQRLQWASAPGRPWQLAWVDIIAVIDGGSVTLNQTQVNGEPTTVYWAFPSSTQNDTYGFLERGLHAHLLADIPDMLAHSNPGAASVLRSANQLITATKFVFIPSMQSVSTIAGVEPSSLANFLQNRHQPKARKTTRRKGGAQKTQARRKGKARPSKP